MQKKAVAIVIVWGILIVLSLLAMSALRLMSNQGFMTESSVRRTKAFYTAKAAMVQALEHCRRPSVDCVASPPSDNAANGGVPLAENGMAADTSYYSGSGAMSHLAEIEVTVRY